MIRCSPSDSLGQRINVNTSMSDFSGGCFKMAKTRHPVVPVRKIFRMGLCGLKSWLGNCVSMLFRFKFSTRVKLVNQGILDATVSRLFEWVLYNSTPLVEGDGMLTRICLRSADQVILSYATSR